MLALAGHDVADLAQARYIGSGQAVERAAGVAAVVEALAISEQCGPLLLFCFPPGLAVEQGQLPIE